jgi:hypothetical protein
MNEERTFAICELPTVFKWPSNTKTKIEENINKRDPDSSTSHLLPWSGLAHD